MTKSEYAVLLTDPRWNEVRLRILKRDDLTCRHCKAKDCRLNVHHKIYLEGKMPWEVPDNYLITLCDYCHAKAHEGRLISSFIRKSLPTKPPKRVNNKDKKRVEKLRKLSEDEKVMIAKLIMLERFHPTSNQWTFYKKQLFHYSKLKKDEIAIINKWYRRAINRNRK